MRPELHGEFVLGGDYAMRPAPALQPNVLGAALLALRRRKGTDLEAQGTTELKWSTTTTTDLWPWLESSASIWSATSATQAAAESQKHWHDNAFGDRGITAEFEGCVSTTNIGIARWSSPTRGRMHAAARSGTKTVRRFSFHIPSGQV